MEVFEAEDYSKAPVFSPTGRPGIIYFARKLVRYECFRSPSKSVLPMLVTTIDAAMREGVDHSQRHLGWR